MKIIFFIFICLNLTASIINMKYIGELSIYGEVGNANIRYCNDGTNYSIRVSGGASGAIATLTNHKKYVYESIGKVVDDKLVPIIYIELTISQDLNKTKTYTFDYENSKVIINSYKKERVVKSTFDIISFKYIDTDETIENEDEEILDKMYENDMVSVFFNKKNNFLAMQKNETKVIYAVGSKDTQKGIIVKLIDKNKDKYTFSIKLNKDYLFGGSNDAVFVLDSDNILYETSLDGILLFGKASIKRTGKQIKKK